MVEIEEGCCGWTNVELVDMDWETSHSNYPPRTSNEFSDFNFEVILQKIQRPTIPQTQQEIQCSQTSTL